MEPVRTTVQDARVDTMRARSVSLARRLLTGAGRASLVAYDLAPLVEAGALSHGLSADGDLVVACLADDAVPATTWTDGPLRVRLDILKGAPEWAVRITACAVHLLGTLALAGFLDAELSDPDSLGIAFDTLASGLQQAAGYSAFRELAAGLE